MKIEEIRQARLSQPFRSFTLHLADGRSFQVKHPEFILASPTSRMVVVVNEEGTLEIIDAILVTSLTIAGEKSSATGD